MHNKSLLKFNQYLRIKENYQKALITSVATSTSIETDVPAETIAKILIEMEEAELKKKDSSQ